MINVDVLIVGSGISGITAARLLAEKGRKVLIVEKKAVIGGACRDQYTEEGINVHLFGPHIFRTNETAVFEFLSRFTKFNDYQHKVTSYVLGDYLEFPININTLKKLFDTNKTNEILNIFSSSSNTGQNFEEVLINKIGRELYSLFYLNYSKKQWLTEPYNLTPETATIIPIRNNIDNRYFGDIYQGIPSKGYSDMLNNMIDHPNIKLLLNTDFREVRDCISYKLLIYTGRLDDYFDRIQGELEYHSVRFDFEKVYKKTQASAVVNYPNDYEYIRKTDYNYFMDISSDIHVVGTEYSQKNGEPLYAVPDFKNKIINEKYSNLIKSLPPNIKLIGRLATYRNLSMGQSVHEAMLLCKEIEI